MSEKNKAMKSKRFRVATEGATTDGRKISRAWIQQMAKNYDPIKIYGARVNLEHIKGILPDSPFRAYGDVLSLSTEEIDGKMRLLAEIKPTDDLVAMNKKSQKVYTSIEVNPSFADTGEAYLVGLAVTDDPASLGTEMLEFSASAKTNPLAARKSDPDNLFTAAEEISLEFVECDQDRSSLFDNVKSMFTRHKKSTDIETEKFRADLQQTFELVAQRITDTESTLATMDFSTLKKDHDQLQAEFTKLKGKLDSTPGTQHHRSTASGNDGTHQTDC